MPESRAKWLARLKREHSLWTIRHIDPSEGYGYTASKPDPSRAMDTELHHESYAAGPPYGRVRLWAATLADLEQLLRTADHPHGRKPKS